MTKPTNQVRPIHGTTLLTRAACDKGEAVTLVLLGGDDWTGKVRAAGVAALLCVAGEADGDDINTMGVAAVKTRTAASAQSAVA